MSEMGLENKGSWAPDGQAPHVITPITSGNEGGSPGDGDLAPGPTAGGGVIGANGNAPIK